MTAAVTHYQAPDYSSAGFGESMFMQNSGPGAGPGYNASSLILSVTVPAALGVFPGAGPPVPYFTEVAWNVELNGSISGYLAPGSSMFFSVGLSFAPETDYTLEINSPGYFDVDFSTFANYTFGVP